MLRILHIADAHLDTPFRGREESLRHRLRDATRASFAAAVAAAVERDVHAFLIAGDLFDNDLLSFATERFLLDQMRRLNDAGIAVFYATGNHDPGRANYRAQQLAWPDNVRLFRGATPETVPIGDAGWLTAAGHSSPREDQNLAAKFGRAKTDRPHVAMLHTQVTSARDADRHDRYAPCSHDDLAAGGFDYWALGHVHLRQRVFDDLPAWYPGNLQGRHPRETGLKGALYVEVANGGVSAPEFLPLAHIVWDSIDIACRRDVATLDGLARALADAARGKLDLDDGREHAVRLDLSGESPLARELGAEDNVRELERELCASLGASWLEVRPRGVVRPVDLAAYRDSPTVLGQALALIEQAQTDDALVDALRPTDLAGQADDERAYLRDLLDGAEREIAARLVPEAER
jgi:DNA repair exonuclease SbcCD nuclease subunit